VLSSTTAPARIVAREFRAADAQSEYYPTIQDGVNDYAARSTSNRATPIHVFASMKGLRPRVQQNNLT
jgi:hypothetical protein